MTNNYTAHHILSKLAQKHSDDVFVPECKDGSTWSRNRHRRLDAWVMKRTWNPPTTIGYEIKVSRSDFLKDDKWPEYMKLCNMFYFVCPTGLIDIEELPEGVGLIWLTKTGNRLYTKRKSARNEDPDDNDLMRYVVMCRSSIKQNWLEQGEDDRLSQCKLYLDHKDERTAVGQKISREISKRASEKVKSIETRNRSLELENSRLEQVKNFIVNLGIDIKKPGAVYEARNKLKDISGDRQIDDLLQLLEQTAYKIKVLKQEGGNC